MIWIAAAVAILVFALVTGTSLLAYAIYALLAVILLSRYVTRRWAEELAATRECSRLEASVGDTVAVVVGIENRGKLPIAWVLFPNFWAILVIQFIGGIAWAGFGLAAGNFLYDVVPPERRAAYSAVHQAISNTAVFGGALLGGLLATHAPRELAFAGYTIAFTSGLWLALCASTVARAVVIAVFLPGLREMRLVRPISPAALAIRVIRANVLAEWLFELLPARRRRPKNGKREGEGQDLKQ